MTEPANQPASAPSSEPALGKKFLEGIYDKLILGVIGGLVATLITNYISRQSHFDEVVSKYTAAVKEYTVSEKLSSLRASKERLKTEIEKLDSFIKILDSDPVKLDAKTLDDYIFDRPKREVADSEYIKYGVDPHNFSDFIACAQGSTKSEPNCEFKDSEGKSITLTPEDARESLSSLLERIRDRKKSLKKEKEEAISQINGLAQSVTVNTLITLSEDSSFLGIAGWSNGVMNFIPFLRNKNLVRRDIVINTLRNSELGFDSRTGAKSKFQYFLEDITIGSFTNQEGDDSKINLSQADLSLARLDRSSLTKLDLRNATLSYVQLNNARVSRSNLSGANLSGASLKNSVFIDSTLEKVNMKQADLERASFQSEKQGSCREFEEKAGIKCYEGVNLKGADLSGANLTNADLKGVDLTGVNLTAAILTGAEGVDLDKLKKDSILCNTILPDGTSYSNNCRNIDLSNPMLKKFEKSTLNEVDFSNSNLAGVKFEEAVFDGSPIFRNTDLTRVDFSKSKITGTQILSQRIPPLLYLDLRHNKICYTKIRSNEELENLISDTFLGLFPYDFKNLKSHVKGTNIILTMNCSQADLSNTKNKESLEVDFSDFNLTGIDFSEANLTNVNFKGATLKNTNFNGADLTNADLTGAKGIDAKKLKSAKAILCRTKLPDGSQDDSGCPQKSG